MNDDYAYINNDLDKLANIEAQLDVLRLQRQELIDTVLTDEIKQQIEDINTEFDTQSLAAEQNAQQLRERIKEDVLEHGGTVKGEFLQAVWNKARVSWDSHALKGYAAVHPEINQLRKIGNPSVTIRKV